MKGALGFLVGLIGLCVFTGVAGFVPMVMRRSEEFFLLVTLLAAFIFLNIMIVGFYRMMGSLHEMIVYPDDPLTLPLRGRALYFTGYIGLLVTLVFVVFVAVMPEILNRRGFRRQNEEIAFVFAWLLAWIFIGCLLGGVLAMLSDLYHKAFYRTAVNPPDADQDDELNIARGGRYRPTPRPRDEEPLRRRFDEE